ncbi:MAG: cell division protein FtsH [Candidatus Levybacteria bacterium RIFCSPHIGHO2_02_FULL_39_36]|nr:MAG: ATP-dependent zinc metalloprotease FtsH [Candidatus Levybacteria bacterium GW2011_GWA1_39_11]OGH15364.1 MAG: cell division protein FtsH [Candidatus Levybacteria bacterium RIFCSPHIGHO2_01_FULL_38_96]OGH26060.1 MAG: cell division protein FtsH [Candidatus Levybacteria bacterium RIFCSPHIGHO2_12_FULL_39_39]OGH28697.1 MAG: cell division protein FtsH [Candidatus Levybacteria bacterium RIFCSPHIGHO2_02_FULL_39_36]OGH36284.1 MAG: cell division protein FtsH [Candidatus Levybacteria bacterium RIFCS
MNGRKRNGKKARFGLKFSWKDLLLYGFLFFFLLFIMMGIGDLASGPRVDEVPISKLVTDIKQNKVKEITVNDSKLEIVYKDGKLAGSRKEKDTSIFEVLKESGVNPQSVKINVKDETGANIWINLISSFLPVVLIIVFFYFIFRQARGAQENIFSFGSSRGKTFNKDFSKTTFADVAGVDEAKQELTEIVDFLKHPEKYRVMGARTPKGVLLVGPSGTGKTLLARAVAGEAQVPFISIAGSEFMEMLVGVGAARVRDLFLTAKKSQPAIIFIDEVDAIGRHRGVGIMGGHDEREQTLNQILVEMDGFTPNEQLVVIAATNRPDILDPALVRPGRFDRRVILLLPDIEGRKAILKIHATGKPFVKTVDWEKVARRTVGYSGADLENMLNEAAILAARFSKTQIDMKDIEEAATKVKLGPEKKRMQSEDDKRITAYHESGHAIVSYFMPQADPVHRISIVGRGLSLGHTLIPPSQDRVHETKTRLLEQIATMLGGRVAEELIFSEMTTGAADDIEKATELARTMVIQYGMSSLGPVNYDTEKARMFGEVSQISNEMQAKIDNELRKIIDIAYQEAQKILKSNKPKLDKVAEALLKKETLEGEEFDEIMKAKDGERKSIRMAKPSGKE